MKRVQSACICQTLHFIIKEDLDHEAAASLVKKEVEYYKHNLDSSKIKYKIVDEKTLDDDSVIIKIKKQYNQSDVGSYLD